MRILKLMIVYDIYMIFTVFLLWENDKKLAETLLDRAKCRLFFSVSHHNKHLQVVLLNEKTHR